MQIKNLSALEYLYMNLNTNNNNNNKNATAVRAIKDFVETHLRKLLRDASIRAGVRTTVLRTGFVWPRAGWTTLYSYEEGTIRSLQKPNLRKLSVCDACFDRAQYGAP